MTATSGLSRQSEGRRRRRREWAPLGARIAAVNRSLRVDVPLAGWRLGRWLLFYVAMLLADAAVIVAVIEGV